MREPWDIFMSETEMKMVDWEIQSVLDKSVLRKFQPVQDQGESSQG